MDNIRKEVPLASLTTFRVGGPAEFFGEPKSLEELQAMLAWARQKGHKVTVLGAGANVLIADAGVKGLVLKLSNNYCEVLNQKSETRNLNEIRNQKSEIRVGAATALGMLTSSALDHCLSGVEFLAGIPGTVGGAIYGNAGGWNKAIGNKVAAVTVVDRGTGEVRTLTSEECEFAYRASRFKNTGEIVWEVTLDLIPDDPKNIRERMREYAGRKNKTQPIQLPSAGCVFTNYEIKDATERERLRTLGVPAEFLTRGNIPAGWLIEQCGLKGLRQSNVEVSTLHGSFLVNHGGATAADILALMERERAAVRAKFGLELGHEVQLLGFDSPLIHPLD